MKCIGIHISNISLQNQFLVLSQRDTGKCKIFSITVHMFIFSTHIITKIHRSKSYRMLYSNLNFLPSIDHFLLIRNINFLTLTWSKHSILPKWSETFNQYHHKKHKEFGCTFIYKREYENWVNFATKTNEIVI